MVEGKVEVLPGQIAIVGVVLSNVGGYYADTAELSVFGLFDMQLSGGDEQDNRTGVVTNVECRGCGKNETAKMPQKYPIQGTAPFHLTNPPQVQLTGP